MLTRMTNAQNTGKILAKHIRKSKNTIQLGVQTYTNYEIISATSTKTQHGHMLYDPECHIYVCIHVYIKNST